MSRGPGRRQQLVLDMVAEVGHLVPVPVTAWATATLGRSMTRAEYRAVVRAVWQLHQRGGVHAQHAVGTDYTGRAARRLIVWTCANCSYAAAGEHIAALPCLYCKQPTSRTPAYRDPSTGMRQCETCDERLKREHAERDDCMTSATDHPAEHCGYPWCQAHGELCDCAYSATQPHQRAGCRYTTDDQEGDE